MALTLVAAIATYALPMLAGLYGGAGSDGQYQMWGLEEYEEGAGIGVVLEGKWSDGLSRWTGGASTRRSISVGNIQKLRTRLVRLFQEEDGSLAVFLGSIVTISAVLSMIGLFIGNGIGCKPGFHLPWLRMG